MAPQQKKPQKARVVVARVECLNGQTFIFKRTELSWQLVFVAWQFSLVKALVPVGKLGAASATGVCPGIGPRSI